jgi:hypothetical protein
MNVQSPSAGTGNATPWTPLATRTQGKSPPAKPEVWYVGALCAPPDVNGAASPVTVVSSGHVVTEAPSM